MGLDLKVTPEGTELPVKVRAGAACNALQGVHAGLLKVSVTQVAEKGKANQAIVKLLADRIGVPSRQVQLIRGATNSRKCFLICGLDEREIRDRLSEN